MNAGLKPCSTLDAKPCFTLYAERSFTLDPKPCFTLDPKRCSVPDRPIAEDVVLNPDTPEPSEARR
jgi:hypothetical protein